MERELTQDERDSALSILEQLRIELIRSIASSKDNIAMSTLQNLSFVQNCIEAITEAY